MGRRIVIVGNGQVAEGADAVIDAADFVVRFNLSRNAGQSGTRTDAVAVCNTGRPANEMLDGPEWRESAPVLASREIWSVRDPEKFARLRPHLAVTHPELDDFCDDRTDDFARFATASGKLHRIVPAAAHEAADAALAAHSPGAYVVPSSGLVTLFHVLSATEFSGSEIVLAGFGHEGWDGHPFAAERRLVAGLAAEGRLRLLATSSPSLSPSQGA
ncbi:Urease operon accessory protein [Rhizobium sp. TRM96647]|uniref:Urease operon accessory protein n=1 Tax=unclassified Rhizobium TaxID=2613769 RepID=UPI0021E94AF1|nr:MULTISPECIES: Urease operon accessory protein [unclassified Rhizobium]MCV3738348.1 Urease operon accessory protein [Rhizobium sp. TRM96647]MCV3759903.1 Urease operon accessory protein [Rhizobium sp. TRM96650]